VLIVGLMSVLTSEGIQSITGLKNLLATPVNAFAAGTFLIVSPESVDGTVVLLIAAGATVGGVVGARFGRRLPPLLMRALIVVVGVAAITRMLIFDDARSQVEGDRLHPALDPDPVVDLVPAAARPDVVFGLVPGDEGGQRAVPR